MKQIIFGNTPKLSKMSFSNNNDYGLIRIYDCINPNIKIGDSEITDKDYGDELCYIPFKTQSQIIELLFMVDVNTNIKLGNKFELIFTDNQKSVDVFTNWLRLLIDRFKERGI